MSEPTSRRFTPPPSELYEEYRNCDRWAIIVGISKYQHRDWNLRYADRDAEELHKLLLTPSGGGFKPENICKLINETATTSNISRALRGFLKKPAREDLVLIYFACHGAPDFDRPGNVYLLTHDTDPNEIAGTALPMREIDDSLKGNLHAEKVVILVDACHSAAIGGGIGGRSAIDDATLLNRYLQDLSRAKGGLALITSAEANEASLEDTRWGGGHGVFTHFLLEGMRGAADNDGNGIVSVGELFEYVRDRVKHETNHRQHPVIGANAYDRALPISIKPKTQFSKAAEAEKASEEQYTSRSTELNEEDFDLTLEIGLTEYEMNTGAEKMIFTGRENITVRIPAGGSVGKLIRVKGKGKLDSRTQQRGNLYLLIANDQKRFQAAEDGGWDQTLELALTLDEMTKGIEKPIFTGYENITVRVPAGIEPGKIIRAKGKGKLNPNTQQRGDLYLRVTSFVVDSKQKSSNQLTRAAQGRSYYQQGVDLFNQGKLDEAIAKYIQALELNPNLAGAYREWAGILEEQGKLKEAIPMYLKAVQLDPKNAVLYHILGDALARNRQFDEAIAAYREAIRLDPKDVVAHNQLGIVSNQQGKIDQALEAYRQAIRVDPKYALGYRNLGVTLQEQGKLDEAIQNLQTAIRLNPNNGEIYNQLGLAFVELGKFDKAEESFRQAIQIDPNNAVKHSNLGATLREQGKLDQAEESCSQAIRLVPNDASAHNQLGMVFEQQGKLDKAVKAYCQAIRVDPNDAWAHNQLGQVFFKQGKLDKAEESFRQAIRVDPNYALGYRNLGVTLQWQGKLDEAIEQIRFAIRCDPSDNSLFESLDNMIRQQSRK